MNLSQAKQRFIHEWGTLCTNWGVNKTMGHVHALMLISKDELCADDIMAQLQISRGNANMNIRALLDWGLVEKICKPGCRKDFYKAQKDLTEVFKIIVEKRKKKEFDPLVKLVDDMKVIKPMCDESSEFCQMINKLTIYTHKVDRALDTMTKGKLDWLSKIMLR